MSFFKSKALYVSLAGLLLLFTAFVVFNTAIEGIVLLIGGFIGILNINLLTRCIGNITGKNIPGKGKVRIFVVSAFRFVLAGLFLFAAAGISKWCIITGFVGYLFPTFVMILFPLGNIETATKVCEGR